MRPVNQIKIPNISITDMSFFSEGTVRITSRGPVGTIVKSPCISQTDKNFNFDFLMSSNRLSFPFLHILKVRKYPSLVHQMAISKEDKIYIGGDSADRY